MIVVRSRSGATPLAIRGASLIAMIAILALATVSCGGDDRSASEPARWTPAADATWQWQLSAPDDDPPNIGYDVDVYDLDLVETPQTTIDALHDDGRRVICYFSAGSSEVGRDDGNFTDADQGNVLDGWPDERWVDLASANVRSIMSDRLDLAVNKGCDGVEPDNTDGYRSTDGGGSSNGLGLTEADTRSYLRWLGEEAHRRGLAIGLKNTLGLADDLAGEFDFAVNEQCHRYGECAELAPFLERGKPVFNAEYVDPDTAAEAERQRKATCAEAMAAGTTTLILPLDLDDSYRNACPAPK